LLLQPPFQIAVAPQTRILMRKRTLTYVAFTRAIKELYLPTEFKNIISLGWQKGIRRYETGNSLKTSQFPRKNETNKRQSGFSRLPPVRTMKGTRKPEAPANIVFKVGDRVITSNGEGRVIDVDDGKYLVALDGQEARLWEKAWGLKKK
jgi:hypothetical protein